MDLGHSCLVGNKGEFGTCCYAELLEDVGLVRLERFHFRPELCHALSRERRIAWERAAATVVGILFIALLLSSTAVEDRRSLIRAALAYGGGSRTLVCGAIVGSIAAAVAHRAISTVRRDEAHPLTDAMADWE